MVQGFGVRVRSFGFRAEAFQTGLCHWRAWSQSARVRGLAVSRRFGLHPGEDVLEVAGKFDQHRIPLDFIWLDLEHTNQKRYFTWDPDHFPREGVRRMLDELNRTQRKLVTIIDPHLFAGDADYAVAARMKGQGFLVKRPGNSSSPAQDFEGFCWPGPSNYPDFCDPRMRREWAKLFDFSSYPGWPAEIYTWNDMNEPSVFDGPEISLPRDTLHRCHEDDYSIEHREVHNLYGFYVHEASTQGHLQPGWLKP